MNDSRYEGSGKVIRVRSPLEVRREQWYSLRQDSDKERGRVQLIEAADAAHS